jgi:hypothetical protein
MGVAVDETNHRFGTPVNHTESRGVEEDAAGLSEGKVQRGAEQDLDRSHVADHRDGGAFMVAGELIRKVDDTILEFEETLPAGARERRVCLPPGDPTSLIRVRINDFSAGTSLPGAEIELDQPSIELNRRHSGLDQPFRGGLGASERARDHEVEGQLARGDGDRGGLAETVCVEGIVAVSEILETAIRIDLSVADQNETYAVGFHGLEYDTGRNPVGSAQTRPSPWKVGFWWDLIGGWFSGGVFWWAV